MTPKVKKYTFLVEVEDHYNNRTAEQMRKDVEECIDYGSHYLTRDIENLSVKNYNRIPKSKPESKPEGDENVGTVKHSPERSADESGRNGC